MYDIPNKRTLSSHNRYTKPPPPQQPQQYDDMIMIKENGSSGGVQIKCSALLPYLNTILIVFLAILLLLLYSHIHQQQQPIVDVTRRRELLPKKHHEVHFKIHLKSGEFIRYPKDMKENIEELNINKLSEYHLCCHIESMDGGGEYFICDNGSSGKNSLECIVKRGSGPTGQSFLEIYAGERHIENAKCTFGWIEADMVISH